MQPTPEFSPFRRPSGRIRHLSFSVVIAVAASGATTPVGHPGNETSVPARSDAVPWESAGPVSLTTELMPNEGVTPLLPDGADNTSVEPPPIIETNRRWTFSVEVRGIYDDNIFLSSDAMKQEDFVFLVTPAVTWRTGDTAGKRDSYATAVYSPSASFFVDHSDENSLDHTVRADVQKRFGKLSAGMDGRYQRLSGATVELSDRVDRDEAGGRLRLRYDVSSRTSVEASAAYNTVLYHEAALADYDEWVAETFVGYALSGRTRMSVGGAIGSMDVDGRESQDFTRAMAKVTTEATGKLTLDAKGGVEFRKTGAGRDTTPVFNVSAEYRPTGRTSAGVSAYRDVTASGTVEDENLTRTGVAVRLQQKLGRRISAGVEAGFEKMEYAATEAGAVSSGREDEYYYVRPSLRYEFREGRRAEIYYSFREDDSTLSNFDFTANQTGLAVAFDF